jgi:hypothetical protein
MISSLAHARVLLLRPSLVRFCLTSFAPVGINQKLDNRMLGECARLCVENAQTIIDLVVEDLGSEPATRVLPWWWRIFYLWIASLHLIAAMLRQDVFGPDVSEHWAKALSTLSAHEHLSAFVPPCMAGFRDMRQKVSDIHQHPPDQIVPDSYQDMFQQLGFETDNPMLNINMDDFAWLGNLDWENSRPD